ncbi:MAG: exo-alpha-sialidase [Acidobacteria bacterium]|nr:exo-alpha-sialidase [Acidobacteriota bacterium]
MPSFYARMQLVCTFGFLMTVATAVASGSDDHPFFETVVPAPSSEDAWINAYPVLDQLPSGRLICIYATQNHGKSAKMKIVTVTSDDDGKSWSTPVVVFDHAGLPDGDPNLIVDGDRILAFVTTLVYPGKIDQTNVYMRESKDGVHWGDESQIRLPHRYVCGKIHHGYKLSDGTLIMGYSWDTWAEQNMPPRTEGEMILKSGVLRSKDAGKTWTPGADMSIELAKTSPNATWGVAEPATVVLADGRVMTLMRAGGTRLYQAWSSDGGSTWSKPVESALTAHNDPAALDKLNKSGEIVVAWDESSTNRYPLAAALSSDGGVHWSPSKIIASSHGYQASYPSVKQTKAGIVLVAWQQALESGGREVHIARFNRAWLVSR